MSDDAALARALAVPGAGVAFLAETGHDTLPRPDGFDVGTAEELGDGPPMEPFDPDSYGSVVSAFLAARTDGYGTSPVVLADGTTSRLEAFDRRPDLGCMVIVITPSDTTPSMPAATYAEVPVRRITNRLDASGRTIAVDPNIEKLLGWTVAEYIDRSSIERVHPDDRDRTIRTFAELLTRPGGETRIRQRYLHRDGRWRWFETTTTNLLQTDDPHIRLESLDISGEMAVTMALQEREALLAVLTDTLPVGVLHLRHDGTPDIVNARWGELVGAGVPTDVDGLLAVVDRDDDVRLAIDDVRSTGEGRDLAVVIRSDSDDQLHVDLSIRTLPHDDEAGPALVLTLADVTASVELNQQLASVAREDHLTGVLNRRGVEELLTERLDMSLDLDRLVLLYLDLDEFKTVNDTFGHAAGDRVLCATARAIRSHVGADDQIGRLGGDEFIAILSMDETSGTTEVVERIRAEIATLSAHVGQRPLTASIGIARARTGDDFDSLLARADGDMYRQKAARRAPSATVAV